MPMPAMAGRAYHGKITLSSARRGWHVPTTAVATGGPEHTGYQKSRYHQSRQSYAGLGTWRFVSTAGAAQSLVMQMCLT